MTKSPAAREPNETLVKARLRLGMSQDDLVRACRAAGWTSCERRTVQRYETGEVTRPHYEPLRTLSRILKLPCDELGFKVTSPGGPQQETSSPFGAQANASEGGFSATNPDQPIVGTPLEGIDEMRRRTFALGMATAGLAVAGASPVEAAASAAEAVRHGLLSSVPGATSIDELEEWEILVNEYAVRHLTTAPATLLRSYLIDLQQLNLVLSTNPKSTTLDLYRVAAVLTSFTAWTYGNLQACDQAGRWWRTAHRLAAASRDNQTRVWVSAQEIIMALYQQTRPVDVILNAVAHAESLAASVPHTPATAWLYCGKAQVLGMAGRAHEAETALQQLRETFSGLASSVTRDGESFLGWPETRLRYTESFAYSHLGNFRAASTAQDQALRLFPSAVLRDPLKVELQRALCLARSGDSADAASHAVAQLSTIDQAQHDLPMADLAARVLRSLPASRNSDEISELQRYVSFRPAITA
jgi:transcriptional regulator with XRE-family HTH domain/tetratricopeptide (TPR) repeat protein